MSYIAQPRRKRFYICMNENERAQVLFIMRSENIPDAAKAIRYCIAEKASELEKRNRKLQTEKAVKHE